MDISSGLYQAPYRSTDAFPTVRTGTWAGAYTLDCVRTAKDADSRGDHDSISFKIFATYSCVSGYGGTPRNRSTAASPAL